MNGLDKKRTTFIIIFMSSFFVACFVTLVYCQIFKYNYYYNLAVSRSMSQETITAPRGEIYDRYGRSIVTNETGFSVRLQYAGAKEFGINKLTLRLAKALLKQDDTYIDKFPLSFNTNPAFVGDYKKVLKEFDLDDDANANDLLQKAVERYDIDRNLSKAEQRIIVGVRYEMTKQGFSKLNSYTFSSSISMNSMLILKEQSASFPGVTIATTPQRKYSVKGIASHILGNVGIISENEYKERSELGYKKTDTIGKDGLEAYLEAYLKGKDGLLSTYTDTKTGEIKTYKTDAEAGNYATLTIDLELQKALEKSLKNTIYDIRKKGYDSRNANAGSAVVIDVNSGEILALASYPTFDLSKFTKNYNKIVNDKDKPLFNRAIDGAYAPGSTFKILTAVAGLEEGVITPNTTIYDKGVYEHEGYTSKSYKPACWLWNSKRATHGQENVVQALRDSCNYFFYDVGRRLGIDRLNNYGKKFGLGQKQGLEISGKNETTGILAGKEYRQSIGKQFYPGELLQASIGQSDNQFTPLQLANFTATFANGGTLYQPHLVKNVKRTDNTEIFTSSVNKLSQFKISKTTFNTVLKGLKDVTETGTASSVFRGYKINVAGKTGSAQVSRGRTNGVFVAFAPAEKPEIAISVVVENAGHGSYVAPVAKAIFDKYFNTTTVNDKFNKKGVILP